MKIWLSRHKTATYAEKAFKGKFCEITPSLRLPVVYPKRKLHFSYKPDRVRNHADWQEGRRQQMIRRWKEVEVRERTNYNPITMRIETKNILIEIILFIISDEVPTDVLKRR